MPLLLKDRCVGVFDLESPELGAFTQRHAVFYDSGTGAEWTPLNHLSGNQAQLAIYNSLLTATTERANGNTVEALPVGEVLRILRGRGAVQ